MILTSNKKHLRANIYSILKICTRKNDSLINVLHAIRKRGKKFYNFQKVAFSDNSQTFEKKSGGKTFTLLKIT